MQRPAVRVGGASQAQTSCPDTGPLWLHPFVTGSQRTIPGELFSAGEGPSAASPHPWQVRATVAGSCPSGPGPAAGQTPCAPRRAAPRDLWGEGSIRSGWESLLLPRPCPQSCGSSHNFLFDLPGRGEPCPPLSKMEVKCTSWATNRFQADKASGSPVSGPKASSPPQTDTPSPPAAPPHPLLRIGRVWTVHINK